MTDTHVTHVAGGIDNLAWLPDNWPKGADVTVVRGHAPEGLAAVLDALPDGCQLRRLCDVPVGWQVELDGGEWSTITAPAMPHLVGLRVCRPVPDPQPRTEPRWGKVPAIEAYDRGLTAKCDWDDDDILVEALRRTASGRIEVLDGNLNRIAYADADGMVEVLVEDDPADTDTVTVEQYGPVTIRQADDGSIHAVSSGRVPTEGDDTTGRRWVPTDVPGGLSWENGPDDPGGCDIEELFVQVDPQDPDAIRAKAALVALVRDAQPLPDADTVMERMTRTPQWTLGIRDRTLIRAALAAVAAIRQETQ